MVSICRLFYVFWVLFPLGTLIHWVLLKKTGTFFARSSFVLISLVGLLACEIGTLLATGYQQLWPLFGYWACLALLIGSAVPVLIHLIRTKVRHF